VCVCVCVCVCVNIETGKLGVSSVVKRFGPSIAGDSVPD